MTQYARPISTIAAGSWAVVGAATHHEATDDEVPNGDSDYVRASSSSDTLKLGLGAVVDPQVSVDHVVLINIKATGSKGPETIYGYLYQGETLIATCWAGLGIARGSYNNYQYTLTAGEADLITDYSALRLWLSGTVGSGEYLDITQAYFACPDAAAYYHGLSVQGVGELALCEAGANPLRIRKGGTTYGIELVDIADPNASAVRIKTGAGIMALRKFS